MAGRLDIEPGPVPTEVGLPASRNPRRRLVLFLAIVGILGAGWLLRPIWQPPVLRVMPDSWLRTLASLFANDAALRREAGERAADALRFEEAERNLRAATELVPEDATAWSRYAEALAERRDFDAAGRALRRALALSPEDPVAQSLEARMIAERDGPDAALDRLESVLARHPNAPEAWYVQGLAYSMIHNTQRAAEAFSKARHLAPRRAVYPRELAQVRHEVGDLGDAESLAREAVRRAADDPVSALVLARVLLDRNPDASARVEIRALLTRASRGDAASAGVARELGRLALLEGDPGSAIASLEDARRIAPMDATTLYYLADAYRKAKDPRARATLAEFRAIEARQREERFLRAAVKEQVTAWPPRRRLIEFYVRHGEREQAARILDDYLQRAPSDARALELGRRLGLARP